jgi:hypothetical protein
MSHGGVAELTAGGGAGGTADVRSVIKTRRRRGIALLKAIRVTRERTLLPISP